MRAPISVVIPTLNAEAPLTGCLTALMEGLEAGLIRELIISDGGSTDMTLTLAEAWGAEIVTGPASRGGQLRRGCAKARSRRCVRAAPAQPPAEDATRRTLPWRRRAPALVPAKLSALRRFPAGSGHRRR